MRIFHRFFLFFGLFYIDAQTFRIERCYPKKWPRLIELASSTMQTALRNANWYSPRITNFSPKQDVFRELYKIVVYVCIYTCAVPYIQYIDSYFVSMSASPQSIFVYVANKILHVEFVYTISCCEWYDDCWSLPTHSIRQQSLVRSLFLLDHF